MSVTDSVFRTPFDQYSRYRAAAGILERLGAALPGSGATLLDVGSGESCLVARFLPDAEATFVDPLLAGSQEANKIGEDVFSHRLDARVFDYVLCLDTLEHIPPPDRDAFIRRLSSLATKGIILGAPFQDIGDALETDRWVADIYRRFSGREYHWLEEHDLYGLPSIEKTLEELRNLGWQCHQIGNGHTPWLRELLPRILCLLEIPLLHDVAFDLSETFNRNLYPFDSIEPVYRYLIVALKDWGTAPLAVPNRDPDRREAARRWSEFLQGLIAEPLRVVGQLPPLLPQEQEALTAREPTLPDLPQIQDSTEGTHEALGVLRAKSESEHATFLRLLKNRIDREADLEKQLAESEERLELLQQDLDQLRTARDPRLVEGQHELLTAREELAAIHGSRLWRFANQYWKLRRFVRRIPDTRLSALLHVRSTKADRKVVSKVSQAHKGLRSERALSYDVFCFPIIDWNFRFQRPQQLSRQFAIHGHNVFYVRTDFRVGATDLRCTEIEDRVYEVQLPSSRPLNIYQNNIDPGSLNRMVAALDDLRLALGDQAAVCVVELPFWGALSRAVRNQWGWRVVYDCMDDHSGFSTNRAAMLDEEGALLEDSDLAVATSRSLLVKTQTSRRSLLLPNATDFEHFHGAFRITPRRQGGGRPVIGYYGAISDWFDSELVERAARERPHWRFVLVGSTFGGDVSKLKRLPNVELVGERPYEDLPTYLASFDVALIPFRRIPLTLATNPVKFYEYLSAGKPIVAVSLPELEPYQEYFYAVDKPEEFVPQIERALSEQDHQRVEDRIELARGETWAARYSVLDGAIRDCFGRAVIIVLSYGNLEYLRMCLESLRTRTLYPRFEILVVDNASPPELQGFLREQQRSDPCLRVIVNEENLGFARANNLAIEAVGNDAEYIVLLNDDTVVPRGWLGRLLRHLDQDPSVGIVGPVTNSIGNEAMIDAPYETLDEMEAFADDHTLSNLGKAFDIPVLAMFCVAMRRNLFDRVGFLDERFGTGMFEDDDFSRRVQEAGLRTVCANDVFVHHWGNSSFKKMEPEEYERLFEENRRRYEEKWGTPWQPHRRKFAPQDRKLESRASRRAREAARSSA